MSVEAIVEIKDKKKAMILWGVVQAIRRGELPRERGGAVLLSWWEAIERGDV